MELVRIAGTCPDGNTCPTVFLGDGGCVVVQGNLVSEQTRGRLTLGANETAVEIPIDLLRKAAQRC